MGRIHSIGMTVPCNVREDNNLIQNLHQTWAISQLVCPHDIGAHQEIIPKGSMSRIQRQVEA